jgi:hypothetical protein
VLASKLPHAINEGSGTAAVPIFVLCYNAPRPQAAAEEPAGGVRAVQESEVFEL